jgi:hypothetical protein
MKPLITVGTLLALGLATCFPEPSYGSGLFRRGGPDCDVHPAPVQ